MLGKLIDKAVLIFQSQKESLQSYKRERGNQTRELKYSLVAPAPKLCYTEKVRPTAARQIPTTQWENFRDKESRAATRTQGEKDDDHFNGCPIRYSNMRE